MKLSLLLAGGDEERKQLLDTPRVKGRFPSRRQQYFVGGFNKFKVTTPKGSQGNKYPTLSFHFILTLQCLSFSFQNSPFSTTGCQCEG